MDIKCSEIFEFDRLRFYLEDKAIARELAVTPQLKDNRRWMVSEIDNQIVGFVGVDAIKNCTFPFKGAGAELKHFYILPDYRRQGIGSKLLAKVIEELNCNIKAVILPSTTAFYEQHGFVKHGNRGKYLIVARLT
jgi:GNAT superfamily N-acetyltransferase